MKASPGMATMAGAPGKTLPRRPVVANRARPGARVEDRCAAPGIEPIAAPRLALTAKGVSRKNTREWLRVVTAPDLSGRAAGTKQSLRVARLLARQMARFGLRGGLGKGRFCQPFRVGRKWDQNVVARRPSKTPGGPMVIVGAHYDGQGVTSSGKPLPGADDNGSGLAALMELARLLGRGAAGRADVVLIAFGGEEAGLLGSKRFVAHPTVVLGRVRMMLNLDMVGRQLLDGQSIRLLLGNPKDTLGYVLSERGRAATNRMLLRVSKGLGISVIGIPESLLELAGFRSDSVPFSAHVPTLFLSTGYHSDYEKLTDTAAKIDHSQIARATRLVLALLEDQRK